VFSDSVRRGIFGGFLTARALLRPTGFGVMGAVFDAEGRVLLVRQSYMPGWRLPGGGAGWGEPPERAVRRELAEEVGLSGGETSLFGLYTARAGLATHLVALYRVSGATIAFKPNLEVREVLFADPAAPPPGIAPVALRRLQELSGVAAPSPYW
jgi:ADP-ribose pyrophosphatase YjhB (NUDIX family)